MLKEQVAVARLHKAAEYGEVVERVMVAPLDTVVGQDPRRETRYSDTAADTRCSCGPGYSNGFRVAR
ncbi:unnamed protein product [Gongylonema pulchrum]|uniref:DUF5753 domain-containing protein n=1 Tax=Gongylonema pulchrum TaxID=637853 RepID=A0A183DYV1_9BILA|nr:unnamed protein product [Gongylonema pulchrum]